MKISPIEILVNRNLENYRGKVWNLCLTIPFNDCFNPSNNIKVLSERILQGGIKLSLWENKE